MSMRARQWGPDLEGIQGYEVRLEVGAQHAGERLHVRGADLAEYLGTVLPEKRQQAPVLEQQALLQYLDVGLGASQRIDVAHQMVPCFASCLDT